ncbi:metallophosphoesterase [Reichenbachiella sp. MALMAid0571]|uniref:metallophosphoesterase n=1 Tax=Reichenbachiella sp. MALMAid0571 TaxID=3143939 RepID=UPI0032DE75E9
MLLKIKFTSALLLFTLFVSGVHAQQRIIKKQGKHQFEIEIDRSSGAPITILQVTDLHLGSPHEDKWRRDLITCRRIKKLVETHDPDMLVITGDLFDGNKPFGNLLAAYAVNLFDGFERPWLYVFGNHDPEGGFGRADIEAVFVQSEWGILGKHDVDSQWKEKYDYVVDVAYKGEKEPKWQLFGFDSGSEKGNKSIKQEQLEWYKSVSDKSLKKHKDTIRAISFFHIPLIEFQYLQDDKSIKKEGKSKEKVYYEEDDGSVYKAFLEQGNMEAVLCGHDHYNNYWGTYKGGIILSYGYISGEATNYAWPPGGKLITLPVDGGEITMENVVPDMK